MKAFRLKSIATLAMAFAFVATVLQPAAAEHYPARSIRLLVGYGAGGGTDLISRLLADRLSKALGQPVVVENRPGAGGTLAADKVAHSKPDGYTLYMMANGHAIAAAVYKSLPYDSVKDFDAIALVANVPLVIVTRPDSPIDDFKELVEAAKQSPGKMTFGSVGVGTTQHFAAELLNDVAKIKLRHIPYKRSPNAIAAVQSGEIDVLFETMPAVLGQIQGHAVKPIAVTSAERFPGLPDLATVRESGLADYAVSSWYALVGPAGLPPAVVQKVNAAVADILGKEDFRKRALEAAFVPATPISSEKAGAHIASAVEQWQKIRQTAGIPQR
jgi:tripartite-type tricarboxylate transporter receptor subunit TctC